MRMNWTEKAVAPLAVVAIHQAGSAIDRVRDPMPVEVWKQAEVYTTYGPAVILTGWNLMANTMPDFLEDMVTPAVTIGLDDLAGRLIAWVTKQQSGTGHAVAEAQRIIAEARSRQAAARGGSSVAQSIARDDRLLA